MTTLLFSAFKTIFSQIAAKLFWWSINRTFRDQLPTIFDKVDLALATAQAVQAPVAVQEVTIKRAIEKVTSHPVTPEELRTVLSLYDPLKAAAKLLQP